MKRIYLAKLQIEGVGQAPAQIEFKPGLNVVAGASDTGKSYVFHAIDYLLGASAPPEDNPHSQSYTRGLLELHDRGGKPLTIERAFGEAEVNIFDVGIAEVSKATPIHRVSASHVKDSTNSLSYLLLEQVGLTGKQVRRNQAGAKMSVTFRHLAHATMVDEEEVITTRSPVLSGQFVLERAEKGVFSLLLTGQDDSAFTPPKVDKKIKDATLNAEIALLQRLISERESRLADLSEAPDEIETQLERLSNTVQEASAVVTATRERIVVLETDRRQTWEELRVGADRRLLLGEQLKRFRVLRDYYESDTRRLAAVLEAGRAFELLPSGACATCGQIVSEADSANLHRTLEAFRAGCQAELAKIKVLKSDLESTIVDTETEYEELGVRGTELQERRRRIDEQLDIELRPLRQSADLSLGELVKRQSDLLRAKDLKDELKELRSELAKAELDRAAKTTLTKAAVHVDAIAIREFCEVLAETLKAWKYPLSGAVSFDPERFDVVIGDQPRGSMGKGYRAITHAAFVISLMRYCRRKGLPHTGFVVVDSPLNPFRGASISTGPDARINDEIKESFYRDLASDISGDQYVILENTDPPSDLVSKIRCIQFTKNSRVGRYGFFPVK